MSTTPGNQDLAQFFKAGHFLLSDANSPDVMQRIVAAMNRLKVAYPFGFDHANGFGASTMKPRLAAPLPSDRAPTIIYHNVGFLEPDLLLPLHNPVIIDMVERVVGKDFYLSNVWLQVVPPHTGRMGYHKDEHGSISITMPLDTIGWNSGSTCLVPASHRNTPPPNFCMPDIMLEHGREAQLTGSLGDVVFFTPETWHGRAANQTDQPTCRLFYNFYSRASRDATRWSPCITADKVAEVAETLPVQYRHMLRIDPAKPKPTATQGRFTTWVMRNGSSSSAANLSAVLREYFYWRFTFNTPIVKDARGQSLPAYRTTITESEQFSLLEYICHLNAMRTVKNGVRMTLNYWMSVFGIGGRAVAKGGD
ncbi:phytanoyl-CoA dioxygenase family protein [Solimicrobium silvestre]|uniref:Phytanoyl-CoA dioxygenase (PhyH) n=1 Tax=Solimicrobium silvestre TaxID=2099400 RepID=A0A2S9GTB5_9BURK|nr:phytanoyl-CoA dioxygenase family protein [Solimicrobium silvestre]PRC90957.1 Phytanoyl-CoA dioxygenase (PhyH) [Solimicrobium silvestre]